MNFNGIDWKLYINILLAIFLIAGCGFSPEMPLADTDSGAQSTDFTGTLPPPVITTISRPTQTNTTAPTWALSPSPTFEPTPSTTPDPYAAYTIETLAQGSFGGGELVVEQVLAVNSYFTRTLVSYPSDGLMIYGFMNTPIKHNGTLPVIIALHGYIEPSVYNTIDYTTRYADALARAGFLVLHPNLRGYPPSDDGDNLFRVGMARDVLNLAALVRTSAGQPGPLQQADGRRIGLWGHSMGGGITTRVITVTPDIQAAVLYGAMSGDDRQNYERIFNYFSNGTRGMEELTTPDEAFLRISPIYYLERVQAAVSIHHGKYDVDVPLAWSLDLCQRLEALEKQVECFTYPEQPHTFQGDGDLLFIQRTIDFFTRTLQ
jgi:dipeptidyl aminopeptidase/acylaminoacyl peptidase